MDKNEIKQLFPLLTELELLEELSEFSIEKTFSAGDYIIRKGQYIKYMPLILSGSIKVMREDENNNEMLLYFLEGGNTCAMSITCCMRQEKSKVWAISDGESRVLLVPIMYVDTWMRKYSSWRNFIMNSYAVRMEKLLFALDAIAFHSLDERLLHYLKQKAKTNQNLTLSVTHSEIAKELHSSREAISRLLKKLEVLGEVSLGRNKVTLNLTMDSVLL